MQKSLHFLKHQSDFRKARLDIADGEKEFRHGEKLDKSHAAQAYYDKY